MARHPQFPILQTDKEVPFDKEDFIDWCIKHQNLSENSAKQYASEVKTAFFTIFEESDTLFDDIKKAFSPKPLETIPEEWRPLVTEWDKLFGKWPDMEDQYETLLVYINEIDSLDEYGEILYETSYGSEAPLPIKKWVRAFQSYANYLRWRINEIYSFNNIPSKLLTKPRSHKEFYNIPLHKEFNIYLRKIHKKQNADWKPNDERRKNSYQGENASYSWKSRLTKLYNYILVDKIPHEVIVNFDERLRIGQKLWLPKFQEALINYANSKKKDFPHSFISNEDVYYGINGLKIYFDFMKAYSKNPEAYQYITYYRKGKNLRNNQKD